MYPGEIVFLATLACGFAALVALWIRLFPNREDLEELETWLGGSVTEPKPEPLGDDAVALLDSLHRDRGRTLADPSTPERIAALPRAVRARIVESLLADGRGAVPLLLELVRRRSEMPSVLRVLGEVGGDALLVELHPLSQPPNDRAIRQAASAAMARIRLRHRRGAESGQVGLVDVDSRAGLLELAARSGALSPKDESS